MYCAKMCAFTTWGSLDAIHTSVLYKDMSTSRPLGACKKWTMGTLAVVIAKIFSRKLYLCSLFLSAFITLAWQKSWEEMPLLCRDPPLADRELLTTSTPVYLPCHPYCCQTSGRRQHRFLGNQSHYTMSRTGSAWHLRLQRSCVMFHETLSGATSALLNNSVTQIVLLWSCRCCRMIYRCFWEKPHRELFLDHDTRRATGTNTNTSPT